MAPPFHYPSNDGTATSSSTTSHSIMYSFPTPTPTMTAPSFGGTSTVNDAMKNSAAAAAAAPVDPSSRAKTEVLSSPSPPPSAAIVSTNQPPQQSILCSPIIATSASFLLRRRLLLPTFAIPTLLLVIPPMAVSMLSMVAYLAGCCTKSNNSSLIAILASSMATLLPTVVLSNMGMNAIQRHAPNEPARRKALAQSKYALPFWSFVISIGVLRSALYFLGIIITPILSMGRNSNNNGDYNDHEYGVVIAWLLWIWGLLSTTIYWSAKTATACIAPAVGWTILSILVLCRYIGPFCPIVRCSSVPLRTNPLYGTLHRLIRNFTSKSRFLDFIANVLDRLSAPSTPVVTPDAKNGNDAKSTNGKNGVQSTTPAMSGPPPAKITTNNADSIGKLLKGIISSASARYSRPGLISILVQSLVHAIGGCIFARAYLLPHIGFIYRTELYNSGVDTIIVLSCALASTFELFAQVQDSELHYRRYSSIVCRSLHIAGGNRRYQFSLLHIFISVARDVLNRVKQSVLGVTILSHGIATTSVLLLSHLGRILPAANASILPPPSFSDIMQSLLISYLAGIILVSVMAIQDVLTRWAVCASGMDADVLMFHTPKSERDAEFLVEDLIAQSVLMGDGTTVEKVIRSTDIHLPSSMTPFKTLHEDEIHRNELAAASFVQWIEQSSTKSGVELSVDILRMCILESLGGGGSESSMRRQSHPFYFGDASHTAAVRRRLDLSAATASPGRQPIVVPIVRALCAFAGGVGDAMSQFYRETDANGKPVARLELWTLPPASLDAMEFSIIAAARLVVMNSVNIDESGRAIVNSLKRNDQLSLLLPCVLQSAFKLRCGISQFAEAKAKADEINLSTYDKSGKGDGLGCYIVAECPDLFRVWSACNNSAKMAMRTIVELGDSMLEEILLRRKWKGGMQQWLVGLN